MASPGVTSHHGPDDHSPLGGSGAYRWIEACPGSVRMSQGVSEDEDPESEYAGEGKAAHVLAEYCLASGGDAWEHIGFMVDGQHSEFYPPKLKDHAPDNVVEIDKGMADAVQEYLDAIRATHLDRNQGNSWVERPFHCPQVHPLMWGRSDFTYLEDDGYAEGPGEGGVVDLYVLHVWDYKHGVGIEVDVPNNPQLMYYGVGMLTDLDLWDLVDRVVLHVAQPRGFHHLGPIREWSISTLDLARWRDEVLVPAMNLAEEICNYPDIGFDSIMPYLRSGEHCRFCPAKFRVCPRHQADTDKLEELMKIIEKMGGAPKATNEQIGTFLKLFEVMKIRQKAARETGYARANQGHAIPGMMLVRARKNREWNDKAEAAAKKKFKKDAYTVSELKSPAGIDKLPGGKDFTTKHAFKPDGGLQLVPDNDGRPEAGPKGRAMFEPMKPQRKKRKKT